MSVAGLLIVTIKGLSKLPEGVKSAVVMLRVLSRKERKVPRSPETVTSVATVTDGVATFDGDSPHIEVYTPFPNEDVIRLSVAPGLQQEAFATASLIRVAVIQKSPRTERTFDLVDPKTKEPAGVLSVVINYVAPTVKVSEDVIAEKLRATAAPGKTLSFKQALEVLQDPELAETAKIQSSHGAEPKPETEEEKPKEEKPSEEKPKEEKHKEEKHKEDKHKEDKPKESSKGKISKSRSHGHHSKSKNSDSKSSGSSGSSNGSKRSSIPPVSTDDITAAMNAENDGVAKSSVPPLSLVAHSTAETKDIMLGPTPRHARESLRNIVEARPRGASVGNRSGDKLKPTAGKNTVSTDPMIVVTPRENLSFGLHTRQASLETDLIQVVTLENKSSSGICFRFLLKNNDHPKYSIYAEPDNGKLKSKQKIEVTLKLVIHCTTNLRFSLPMVMWKGHLKDYETAATETQYLTAGVQSKLSTHLDSEEVEIFRPPIGSGAFGTVYRGKYRGFEVAVKVLKDQANPSPELLEAFECEVEMAEALRHTSIVNFVGAVHFKNQLAIVTEFCPFGDLNSALKKYPFPYPLKLKALLDASRAMDYLHQSGMIHRDLKTENLLVVSLEAMSQTVCKLSDFGTARGLNSFAQAKTMALTKGVGTPIFMAPEMLTGSQNYTESADVYSFGVMMCHVANSELPYTRDRRFDSSYQFVQKVIQEGMRPLLKADVPADYQKLMTACWNQVPTARPPFCDISDMLEDMFFAARSSLPSASILNS